MTERSAVGYVRTLLKFQRDGMTGTLAVGAEEVTTFVRFREGKVVFADGGTLGETLGRLLVDDEIISPEQYAKAIQVMTENLVDNEQMRLGEVLVTLRFMSLEEVHDALAQQVRRKIIRCLQWEKVTLEFDPDPLRLEGIGHFPVTIEPVVLEGVRRYYDQDRRDEVLDPYLPHYAALREEAAEVIARFKLADKDARLVREIGGALTLREVVETSDSGDWDPSTVVTALLLADEIEALAEPLAAEPEGAEAEQEQARQDAEPPGFRRSAPAADPRYRPPARTARRPPKSGRGMMAQPEDHRPPGQPAREAQEYPEEAARGPTGRPATARSEMGALRRRQRPTGRSEDTLDGVPEPARTAHPLPRRGRRTGQGMDPAMGSGPAAEGRQPGRNTWGEQESGRQRPSRREDEPRRQHSSWREEEPRRQQPSWGEQEPRRQRPSWREEEPRRQQSSWHEEEPRRQRSSWHEEEPRRQRSSWHEEEPRRPQPSHRVEQPRRPRPSRRVDESRRPRPSHRVDPPRRRSTRQGDEGPSRRPAPQRRTVEPAPRDHRDRSGQRDVARRMIGTHRALGDFREDSTEEERRREAAELLGGGATAPPHGVRLTDVPPSEKPVDIRKQRLEAEQAHHRGIRLLWNQRFAEAHTELARAAAAIPDAVEYRLSATWAEYRLCQEPEKLDALRGTLAELARAAARQDGGLAFPPYVLAHLALAESDEILALKLFRIAAHREPACVDAERHVRLLAGRVKVKAKGKGKGRR